MARRKRQETEHAEPVAHVAGKRIRGAGAPTKDLKGSTKRPDHYHVPREIIHPRALNLKPLVDDPYHLDG